MAELAQSIWAGTSDVRLEVDEVLARGERAAAVRLSVHATSRRHGIRSQTATGAVIVVQDGRLVSWDQYDDADRATILARHGEVGDPGEVADGGPSEPERFFAEFFERLRARDYDRLAELIDEGWSWTDHRALGWEDARGREACLTTMRSLADAAPGVMVEFDEILACDERVIAARLAWRGRGIKAGELEVLAGAVFVVEDRRWFSADFYDPDDRHALIARYAELGGGLAALADSPPERLWREVARSFAARDAVALPALYANGTRLIDHRQLPWGDQEVPGSTWEEQVRRFFETVWELSEDVRFDVDEVLAADEHAIALSITWTGTAVQGTGPFEIAVGVVNGVRGGRFTSFEQYEPTDREAMLARVSELSQAAAIGETPAG